MGWLPLQDRDSALDDPTWSCFVRPPASIQRGPLGSYSPTNPECVCVGTRVHVHSLGGPSQPYLVVGVSLPGAGDCFVNPSTLNPKLGGFGGRREPESSTPVTSSRLFLQGGEISLLPVG